MVDTRIFEIPNCNMNRSKSIMSISFEPPKNPIFNGLYDESDLDYTSRLAAILIDISSDAIIGCVLSDVDEYNNMYDTLYYRDIGYQYIAEKYIKRSPYLITDAIPNTDPTLWGQVEDIYSNVHVDDVGLGDM